MKHKQVMCGYCAKRGHSKRSCEVKKEHNQMFTAAIFPQKFKPGQLVVTSLAPPRWDGEHPRGWGTAPEGTLAVVTSEPCAHYHTWGGLYDIVYVSGEFTGTTNQICGDFLRPRS